jgi:hypothetical protein
MTSLRFCNKSSTAGATSGAGTAYYHGVRPLFVGLVLLFNSPFDITATTDGSCETTNLELQPVVVSEIPNDKEELEAYLRLTGLQAFLFFVFHQWSRNCLLSWGSSPFCRISVAQSVFCRSLFVLCPLYCLTYHMIYTGVHISNEGIYDNVGDKSSNRINLTSFLHHINIKDK